MYSVFFGGIRMPVTPSSITTKIKNFNKTFELLGGGEINVLKQPGLSTISFKLFIPHMAYPFVEEPEALQPQNYYLDLFELLKKRSQPFAFAISRLTPNGLPRFTTSSNVSLEAYTIEESAENGLDLWVDISLKIYRKSGFTKLPDPRLNNPSNRDSSTETTSEDGSSDTVNIPADEMNEARIAKEPSKFYTVKAGDTLWAICRKELGNGEKYGEVAKLNGIANPNRIYPGQVIYFE
ncbi:LysM peptidoglycan-binding domain-containing protein [Fusibacter paucivorans]|uniref:LysM peptidoglycan-binding domain-containing protein n=1 Tax=Fusibacter paucivorans TaxID=76009 RepID=A0ABS5PRZ7_9FIRM|nr:LysM peptidoglycan-binding domain-containing protein [Fusibacter paucivorans]MBS7527846.1 LysM peptidoglycan-binding domain-containing protein [Fusibacter paucivorans]